jgi:hypothetical protein
MSAAELVLAEKPNVCASFAKSILMASPIATLDGSLSRDYELLAEGHAVYVPGLLCDVDDFSLLKELMHDLALSAQSDTFVARSRHAKIENPDALPTLNKIVRALALYFDMDVFATRLNFYADNSAWKPFHHDSHAYAKSAGAAEDFTVGVSLGAERELVFKHVESGQQFSFPQRNGDLFAFDSAVNKRFQHGVPRARERIVGPRFSIIAWGRRRTLSHRSTLTPLLVPGPDAIAAHGPPTNETEKAEKSENEAVCLIDDVVRSVDAFVEQQLQKKADAEAAKQASKQKATERAKAKPRVQGGWSKQSKKN